MPRFKNSCCVPLDNEQVMVDLDEHGRPLAKYLIRIEGHRSLATKLWLWLPPRHQGGESSRRGAGLGQRSRLGIPASAFAVAAPARWSRW